jgi:hemerythrin superfamily protein
MAQALGMSALDLLRQDHQRLKQMLQDYGDAQPPQKDTWFELIKHELDRHAAIEEELFYPAVARSGEEAEALVREARHEHADVRAVATEIGKLQPTDSGYDQRVAELRDRVLHHAEEEEARIFPLAEQSLGAERLASLGREMADRGEALRTEMAMPR